MLKKLLTGGWLIGILLGSVAGYLYWYFIGCNSGSCAIASSPVNSTLYGALMGFLLVGSFRKEEKSEPK